MLWVEILKAFFVSGIYEKRLYFAKNFKNKKHLIQRMKIFYSILLMMLLNFTAKSQYLLDKYQVNYDALNNIESIDFFFKVYMREDADYHLTLRKSDYEEYKRTGFFPMRDGTILTLKTTTGDSVSNWQLGCTRYAGKYKKFKIKVKKGEYLHYSKGLYIRNQILLNCSDFKEIIIKHNGEKITSFDLQPKKNNHKPKTFFVISLYGISASNS